MGIENIPVNSTYTKAINDVKIKRTSVAGYSISVPMPENLTLSAPQFKSSGAIFYIKVTILALFFRIQLYHGKKHKFKVTK